MSVKLEQIESKKLETGYAREGTSGHHLDDFLPKEQLDMFMHKLRQQMEGKSSSSRRADYERSSSSSSSSSYRSSDSHRSHINSENVGHQMLQKMGWTEGKEHSPLFPSLLIALRIVLFLFDLHSI